MKEALFYQKEKDGNVRCNLCRFRCLIGDGSRGICAVRENHGGTLYSLVYGKLCAEQIDPIEKKPLFHVLPGSRTYSIAAAGCNFHCDHCQNHTISQVGRNAPVRGNELTPQDIVRRALASDCSSISYTYTEPTMNYEFACETAGLAQEAGLQNIFVTNGYISKEALKGIAPFIDAANIDLKGFSEGFYEKYVGARLAEVLDSIMEYRKQGVWVELTTLLIPGLNDADSELTGIADYIVTNLGVDTPWHVTQFYPTFKMTERFRTPAATLRRAVAIGLEAGLHYVYAGSIGGENTFCPFCKALLLTRNGFTLEANSIRNGHCPDCNAAIAGIRL